MPDLSASDDHRLQRILRGIKIFHAARETEPRKRLPITRDLLLCLVSWLDPTYHEGATLRAAFCVASAALLRIGEFTCCESYSYSRASLDITLAIPSVRVRPPGQSKSVFQIAISSFWDVGSRMLISAISKSTLNTSLGYPSASKPSNPPSSPGPPHPPGHPGLQCCLPLSPRVALVSRHPSIQWVACWVGWACGPGRGRARAGLQGGSWPPRARSSPRGGAWACPRLPAGRILAGK